MQNNPSRREVVRSVAIAIGGLTTMLVLPQEGTEPIVQAVVAPAYAFSTGEFPPSLCFDGSALVNC